MKIVMKGHTVEVALNYETSSIKLEKLRDAIVFTEVLRKISERGNNLELPRNYLEVLRTHLVTKGRICCKTQKQIEKTDRLNMLAALTSSLKRSVYA